MKPRVNFTTTGNSYALNTPVLNQVVTAAPYRTSALSYGETYGVSGLRTSGLRTSGVRLQPVQTVVQAPTYVTTQVPAVQEVRVAAPVTQVVRAPSVVQEVRAPQVVYQQPLVRSRVIQTQPLVTSQVVATPPPPPPMYVASNQNNYNHGFVKEPKKRGFCCSPLFWALLGLLALIGLTLGLLFAFGVLGGKKGGQAAVTGTQPIVVPAQPVAPVNGTVTVPTIVSPGVLTPSYVQPVVPPVVAQSYNVPVSSVDPIPVQFVTQTQQYPLDYLKNIPPFETRPRPVTYKTEVSNLRNN